MTRVRPFLITILVLFAAITLATPAARAQEATSNPRIALVVGNATYGDAALATTANDAGLVAQILQAAGFDVVGARDLDGQSLRSAFRDFLDKAAAAGPDMQAFVYLSGRAIQYNGDNYFVPIDATINRDADAPIEAFRISDLSTALAGLPGRVRIIVIDGARANPYAAVGAPLAPGLALVDPEPGELIAFNAAPGTLAGDEPGPYGVYAKTLAGAMRQGGVDIGQVFDQTRLTVNSETQGALLPWNASKLDGPYFVFERMADAPASPPSQAPAQGKLVAGLSEEEAYAAALQRDTIEGYREFLAAYPDSAQIDRVRAILAVRREASFWRRTVTKDTPGAYWTYLQVYPRGPHVPDARRRLFFLSAAFEPPADFQPEVFEDLPPPPPDELVYEERSVYAFDEFGPPPPPPPAEYVYAQDDDWRDLPPPPPPVAVGILPVLAVAVPIAAGAVAYHGPWHTNGVAPAGAPRLAPPPLGPPPLPANVRPVAPRPPAPPLRAPANMAVVKPLPPIAPPAATPQAPAPAGPAGAKPPAVAAPATTAKPRPVLPVAPAAGAPPAASPGPSPAPAGARLPAAPAPTATKPVPAQPVRPAAGPPPAATPVPPPAAVQRPAPAPAAARPAPPPQPPAARPPPPALAAPVRPPPAAIQRPPPTPAAARPSPPPQPAAAHPATPTAPKPAPPPACGRPGLPPCP